MNTLVDGTPPMPWARFDDHMPTHRKIRPLSDAAFRLWVSAVCWCAANKTDGYIDADDLRFVADVADPHAVVPQLTARGLWEEVAGGWIVHDFHDYNPSVAQVATERAQKAERQKRWRDKHRMPDGSFAATANVDASPDGLHDVSRDAAPDPTRPDPTVISTPASAQRNAEGSESQPTPPPRKPKRPAIEAPEHWERFWKAYPRKKDKGAAERAWNTAIRNGTDPKTIIDGLLFYVLDCRVKDPQFIKYPATWLNARGWQDEADPQPAAPRAIGAPSEAAAVQPRAFADVMAEHERLVTPDFGDPFRMPE